MGRCCERVEFVTVSVEIQSEEIFCSLGCESSEEHMREFLSSFIARVLGRLGGVLCSPCVPDIHRLVRIPGVVVHFFQHLFSCEHGLSLHITIKAQTQKHIVHWTHLLRAFPDQYRYYDPYEVCCQMDVPKKKPYVASFSQHYGN